MEDVFRLRVIDDEDRVSLVSFVDYPAIEVNLIAFSKEKEIAFNDELRIVTMPLLIPDKLIPRTENGKKFNVVALKEDVVNIYEKFVREKRFNELTLNHNSELKVGDNAYLYEIFLSDERRGIKPPDFFNYLPNNTIYASYKIVNDDLWRDIKEGKFNGASIEGKLTFEKIEDESESDLDEIIEKLKKISK